MNVREEPTRARVAAAAWLAVGVLALIVATASGGLGDLLEAIVGPPPVVRAFLAAIFVVLGLRLLALAMRRIEETKRADPAAPLTAADLGGMLRGIRFVFLAAASFAASTSWLLGEPLPLVIALVIAGVDLAETSLLLLVATRRSG